MNWENLSEADLCEADLGGWTGANPKGANLLKGVNLSGAKYNADTKWPEGFDTAAAAVLVER
mgnify:CR=1 FL=1